MPRSARKRGSIAAKRGLLAEQIQVLIARTRHGEITDGVTEKRVSEPVKWLAVQKETHNKEKNG